METSAEIGGRGSSGGAAVVYDVHSLERFPEAQWQDRATQAGATLIGRCEPLLRAQKVHVMMSGRSLRPGRPPVARCQCRVAASHGLPGDETGCPRPLEIESTELAGDIHDLADKE